jgi:peptidoglycan-N-acetylglucosamine deacetylase
MKPIASISLDLDDKWSYIKTHGDPAWKDFPSYLNVVVPRVLDFLETRHLCLTVFIVGQDAAFKRNYEVLRSIAAAGHEIGNHSFHHEPWLHLYSHEQIETELAEAEEHIEHATGIKPLGFRAPGYSLSSTALHVLAQRGYVYDSSTLPNLLAPIARAIYFMNVKLTIEQKRQRKILGGTFRDALRPVKPYRWNLARGALIEMPVTTFPIFKIPIHMSYLMCLRMFSHKLAFRYFSTALSLCRLTDTEPSLVLHPTDFLGSDDAQGLSFFPAMRLPSEIKIAFVSDVLNRLTAGYTLLTIHQHAVEVSRMSRLAVVEPRFS